MLHNSGLPSSRLTAVRGPLGLTTSRLLVTLRRATFNSVKQGPVSEEAKIVALMERKETGRSWPVQGETGKGARLRGGVRGRQPQPPRSVIGDQ